MYAKLYFFLRGYCSAYPFSDRRNQNHALQSTKQQPSRKQTKTTDYTCLSMNTSRTINQYPLESNSIADTGTYCSPNDSATNLPFLIENETPYRQWRERKLTAFMTDLQSATEPVTIINPKALSTQEYDALTQRCRRRNFAFYRLASSNNPCDDSGNQSCHAQDDKLMLKQFWAQLGLHALVNNPCADTGRISNIEVTPNAHYIPYTAQALKWHTDGYYNADANTISAFAMHCAQPAEQGGENQFFDPEILYILLRDENPDYVATLMHRQSLTIPPNTRKENLDTRHAASVPVLALHPQSGDLVMRYTERRHHVIWRKNDLTTAARAFIHEVLHTPSKYHLRYRLNYAEGVICNNALHNRSSFTNPPKNAPQRLLYRARYRERIIDTGYTSLLNLLK